MASTVTSTVENGLATLRLGRPHGNAINADLVRDLSSALLRAKADPGVRGVLLAGAGKLFCPGLDLQELVELDRPAMERFFGRFRACLLALYTFPKPLVAALHGHALAGGCIFGLTADWRVLCEGAMVGLNEVRIGVPLPFGVALILRESVPASRLEEVALLGRNYTGDEAVRAGLAHEGHVALGFEAHCLSRLAELADRDSRAFEITKRYLRSATVERVRAADDALAGEFLDAWFSAETRERIARTVEELRRKKG